MDVMPQGLAFVLGLNVWIEWQPHGIIRAHPCTVFASNGMTITMSGPKEIGGVMSMALACMALTLGIVTGSHNQK